MTREEQAVLARARECQSNGGEFSKQDLAVLLEMATRHTVSPRTRALLVRYTDLLEAWWDKTTSLGAEEAHDLRNILQILFACREDLRGPPVWHQGEQ